MSKTRVLVVDDSALMRELLTGILRKDPEIEVVGAAADPIKARQMIETLRPDVLTLDVEMPRMDGLTFLEKLMAERPLPVVMVSSLTEKGSTLAVKALELGAIDVVEKPKIDLVAGTFERAQEILSKVRHAASVTVQRRPSAGPSLEPERAWLGRFVTTDRIIAIGASTGGVEALVQVIRRMPPGAPGIVIVQHMPPKFTDSFAQRLGRLGPLRAKEAADGDPVQAGHVLLAPGGRHMRLLRSGGKYVVRVSDEAPLNHHKPSVDVLFHSCAEQAGRAAVGVLLTGMGSDGADGMLAMRRAGSPTIAQDEATSVVFGMPKEAINRGAAAEVMPLDRIAGAALKAAV